MLQTRWREAANAAGVRASGRVTRESGMSLPAGRGLGKCELNEIESSFAGQIATAVWLGKLTEDAACEALLSYAIACHLCERAHAIRLRIALLTEYRRWRERQDLAS